MQKKLFQTLLIAAMLSPGVVTAQPIPIPKCEGQTPCLCELCDGHRCFPTCMQLTKKGTCPGGMGCQLVGS